MKLWLSISALLCFSLSCYADTSCGEWEPYKDEKCFKILDITPRTFEAAEQACNALKNLSHQSDQATLPVIHSVEEQEFIATYLFKMAKNPNNFWIGAHFVTNKWLWVDNTELDWTNWSAKPRNESGTCVEMEEDETIQGKWKEAPCGRTNYVVCQKVQTWSVSKLQETLLNARKELRDSLTAANAQIADLTKKNADLTANLANANNQIGVVKNSIMPVGSIYAQVANEASPDKMWPWMKWQDVSATYAGVFFRVYAKGVSEEPGKVQAENSPRLVKVGYVANQKITKAEIPIIANGAYSELIYTGNAAAGATTFLHFAVSAGEVRPKNMAIRIWKRIG